MRFTASYFGALASLALSLISAVNAEDKAVFAHYMVCTRHPSSWIRS